MAARGARFSHVVALLLLAVVTMSSACRSAEPPSHVHVAVLTGTPYERGLAHGLQFGAQVRSLYTRLLTTSILPFLNREQINIAPILNVYDGQEYRDGSFSRRLILESGHYLLENYLPADVEEELQGLADGAGMSLDEVLALNTFVDTMMAFRAIVLFIVQIQTPYIVELEIDGDVAGDGVDNDGDGRTDEDGEGRITEYTPSPHALLREVPTDATLRVVLRDRALGGLACPDPRNVEPFGEMSMAARCVDAACVRPSCAGLSLLERDCLRDTAVTCMAPRIDADCFDPACMELADPVCVDPQSVRIHVDGTLYTAEDPAVTLRLIPDEEQAAAVAAWGQQAPVCQGDLEIVFAPPSGFAPASVVSVLLQATDLSPIYSPEPFHARSMRDERFAFTTAGYEATLGAPTPLYDIPNEGVDDGLTQPPALAFAARGTATADGAPILAQHFALLDTDVVHEHTALLVHVPEEGRPFVTVGWTGLVWGFSTMNDEGLVVAFQPSDSLDNPMLGGMLEDILDPENLRQLIASPNLAGLAAVLAERQLLTMGTPMGFAARQIVNQDATVEDAVATLYGMEATYGWNVMLADAAGEIAVVELDTGVQSSATHDGAPNDLDGFMSYSPDESGDGNTDRYGRRWSSVGPDDIRMTSHFSKNVGDMMPNPIMGIFSPQPQRVWTGFYYRSVRAWHLLGEQIASRLGAIDVPATIEILRYPPLVDTRDSMNAVIYEPARARLHWAMGQVPATDAPFETFDLGATLNGGAP